jgi:glutamyl-tRNA synthetase
VRFRSPETGTTVLEDVIKGPIVFQNHELDDFVIARSDGTPTYNFVVVVDDMTMKINTILRGDDHVSNTPKQILLYRAFGHPLPVFGHLPMVLGPDKTRLSKRHGAMSVTEYRDMGFLPDAMLNYLVRLGWSHGDQEFFEREELITKFSLEHIGKSAGVFDLDKLHALNADHMRALLPEALGERLLPFLSREGIDTECDDRLEAVVTALAPRSKTLCDMATAARFFYSDTVAYEEKAARKFLKIAALEPLSVLVEGLTPLETFDEVSLETVFRETMEKTGLKLGKIAQPVRVALTGSSASPGIFEVIAILGKERTLKRLSAAVAHIREQQG